MFIYTATVRPGYRLGISSSQGKLQVRRRLSTMSIWLGLFAMLMIHAGPLYSALQMQQSHMQAEPQVEQVKHHGQVSADEPAWLAALELCGYCELLTFNPPLNLSLDLVLPRHGQARFAPLPDEPWRDGPELRTNQARAPPRYFHS